MVRKSAAVSRSSKRVSQISGLKRLSLQDAPPPEAPVIQAELFSPGEGPVGLSDRVYLHAASIFQSAHLEKPPAHRLISFGRRSHVFMPAVRDDEMRSAYQLTFNTLKYQELLEDVLIDSSFCLSQPMGSEMSVQGGSLQSADWMSLVAVMLSDLMDRKFLPREQPANQEREAVQVVRQVEACLLRFKTKLEASLARCRIKHDLLTLDGILPENIRHRQERAAHLPLYGWVNTLRASLQEVSGVLAASGFSCVKSVGQLEGRTFSKDPHCSDLLMFPNTVKTQLMNTHLLTDHKLIIQDKSCCVGPCALRPLLAEGGDVLMAGCFSALTVAHVRSVVLSNTQAETHTSGPHGRTRVFVCLGDRLISHREELQNTLIKLGCENVTLLPDSLHTLDACDVRLQKVRVILLIPACSLSGVSNPVDYILQENRDPQLLRDLSQGLISPAKLQTLVCQQRKDLQRALHFPQVCAVLYSTCSVFSEENEGLVDAVLSETREIHSTAQPYRLSVSGLLQMDDEESEKMKPYFFKLEASDVNNGCFLALLTREPETKVTESPQEVLARAAAKGLLDNILPNQPIKKEGRVRKSRKAPANQTRSVQRRSHTSLNDQSCVTEFLNREMKESRSEPAVGRWFRTPNNCPPTPQRTYNGNFSRLGSAPNPTPSSSSSRKSLTRLTVATISTNGRCSSVPVAPPPAPPKGRQEVLRPAAVTFPVMFPNDTLLPLRRSDGCPEVRVNPTYTHLPWSKTPPIEPQTRTSCRALYKHRRPWL